MTRDPVTNHTSLSTRATALQREIENAFRPPSKRQLKHTEAMDILARVDGFRNREAAAAADASPAVATDAAPAGGEKMFDADLDVFEFDVPIKDDMGFLGAGTNGAPPDLITAIRIECDATGGDGEDVAQAAGIWLKGVCDASVTANGRTDMHFLYASGWKEMKQILSLMMEAERRNVVGVQDGPVAYANWAQMSFDEETSQEAIHDVEWRCVPDRGGFDLKAYEKPGYGRLGENGPAVARLEATLEARGLKTLALRIQQAERWFEDKQAKENVRRHREQREAEAMRDAERAATA